MNGKAWTANPLLVGLLLLALGVPCAFAADDRSPAPEPLDASTQRARHVARGQAPARAARPEAGSSPIPATRSRTTPRPSSTSTARKHLNRHGRGRRSSWAFASTTAARTRRVPPGSARRIRSMPAFMAYGDLRVAAAYYDNGARRQRQDGAVGARRPPQPRHGPRSSPPPSASMPSRGRSTRTARSRATMISGAVKDKFVHNFDFNLDTLFFEGDLGAMRQGLTSKTNPIDLPIAFGRMPIVTQNGVWIEDAIDGAAFSITAKNSPSLDISNIDLTFFAGFNKVTTAADPGATRPSVFGIAGFADAAAADTSSTATATSTPTSDGLATTTSPPRSASGTAGALANSVRRDRQLRSERRRRGEDGRRRAAAGGELARSAAALRLRRSASTR